MREAELTKENLKKFLQEEYYKEAVKVKKGSIRFVDISKLSENEIQELTKIYMNLFNMNNHSIYQKFGIGKGLWKEPLWNMESAGKRIEELRKVATLVAVGRDRGNKQVIIGASSYEEKSYKSLIDRWRYSSGNDAFTMPDGISLTDNYKVFYAKETFKRRTSYLNDEKLTGLASKMKENNENRIIEANNLPLAFAATTRNEHMKKVWVENGYYVFDFNFYDDTSGWGCVKIIES